MNLMLKLLKGIALTRILLLLISPKASVWSLLLKCIIVASVP